MRWVIQKGTGPLFQLCSTLPQIFRCAARIFLCACPTLASAHSSAALKPFPPIQIHMIAQFSFSLTEGWVSAGAVQPRGAGSAYAEAPTDLRRAAPPSPGPAGCQLRRVMCGAARGPLVLRRSERVRVVHLRQLSAVSRRAPAAAGSCKSRGEHRRQPNGMLPVLPYSERRR